MSTFRSVYFLAGGIPTHSHEIRHHFGAAYSLSFPFSPPLRTGNFSIYVHAGGTGKTLPRRRDSPHTRCIQ